MTEEYQQQPLFETKSDRIARIWYRVRSYCVTLWLALTGHTPYGDYDH